MRTMLMGGTALLFALAATALATPDRGGGPEVIFTGRVTDAATGAPLAGAQVRIVGSGRETRTASDGHYRLVAPRGAVGSAVQLQALHLGYRPAEAQVRDPADRVTRDFRLQPDGGQISAVDRRQPLAPPPARVASAASEASFAGIAPASVLRARSAAAQPWNTEGYDRIHESGFVDAAHQPLSTFSIDVDRASYSNVRRFIRQGQAPPPDAVRIEEMLNYFPYAYPEPRGEHPFSVTTELAAAPWRPGHRLMRIGLQSRRLDTGELPPSNLVFLIDVSGSMRPENRLPLVKRSLRLLVDELRPRDRVAIVVYAGAAGLILPSTPGSEKERILDALERLEAGGSTAGGAGLRLAYDVARQHHLERGNNRVILATDGDFNVGVSSDAEMVRLVEERRRQGTFLTVLGFGMGNLQDAKMEKMAHHGNGNYAYIDDLLEARKVLVREMGGTLLTVAKDVKLQVEFNPERVRGYRLVGYENRRLQDHEFNDDTRDAGDMGAGHSVTALYEIIPAGVDTDAAIRGVDPLRYRTPAPPSRNASGGELAWVKLRYKEPAAERSRRLDHVVLDRPGEISEDLSFAAAVAGFGMILRGSEFRGHATVDRVLALARRGQGGDPAGYRSDFVQLVERYRAIRQGEVAPAPER